MQPYTLHAITLAITLRFAWSSPLEKRALSDTVLVLFTAMAAAVSSPERDSKTNPTVARSRPPPYHSRLPYKEKGWMVMTDD